MKNKILRLAADYQRDFSYLRWGQCVFNAAYDLYPDMADALRASEFDCFYNDKLVDRFIDEIIKA